MVPPASGDEGVVFLLRLLSHVKDLVGEKAAESLIHYAAAEAALEHWALARKMNVEVPTGVACIESLLGADVHISRSTRDSVVATANIGPFLAGAVDKATANAILIGVIQAMHQRSIGQFPDVVLTTPLQEDPEIGH